MKLKTLPMTSVMYLRLVNKIFGTTAARGFKNCKSMQQH